MPKSMRLSDVGFLQLFPDTWFSTTTKVSMSVTQKYCVSIIHFSRLRDYLKIVPNVLIDG